MYRRKPDLQLLLVHPGGPFWKKKDKGAWTIPKGEPEPDEDLLKTAIREFQEETGFVPSGPFLPLGSVRQRAGKMVHAWGIEGDCNPSLVRCATFKMQWPPCSGKWIEVPEIDQAKFFPVAEALLRINTAQVTFIRRLEEALDRAG